MNENNIVIAALYKFVVLDDYESLRPVILQKMKDLGVKGTLILASEGINGTFAAAREEIEQFYAFLRADERFADLYFRETFDAENPFQKSKVKLRREIVTMGIQNVNPNDEVGEYLDPEQWDALINDPDVVLIDTRNTYEYHLGTFKNAINPETDNFRSFPEYVEETLKDKKDSKIAMFCTGGIRCEKSTAYLKKMGYDNVYHLKGGIIRYLQDKQNKPESMWEGYCFVFDERVAIDNKLQRVMPQLPEKNYGEAMECYKEAREQ